MKAAPPTASKTPPTDGKPLGSKLSARRTQTRERLLQAARTVFAERGVEGASVEEICEAAGFTRGAFYSNFADRTELVFAIIQQSIEREFAIAGEAIAAMKQLTDSDPLQLVGFAVAAMSGSGAGLGTSRTKLITDRAMQLYAARNPELWQTYLEFLDSCESQLEAIITDALAHAQLELTVPPRTAVKLLIASHEYLQTYGLFDPSRVDPAMIEILVSSITRPTGQSSAPVGATTL